MNCEWNKKLLISKLSERERESWPYSNPTRCDMTTTDGDEIKKPKEKEEL